MLASMYSAVSGLSVHQTKMDTIGNNVSNVNTYGFKSSRVTFSDVFYQNYAGASAPTTTQGGTNASQLGYGASLGTIDVLMTRGGSATTDRSLDVYINGDGFLPVQDSSGNTLYTRLGNLYFDVQGNLVDGNGNKALGLTMNDQGVVQLGEDGTTTTSSLEAISVAPEKLKELTSISIGSTGAITAIQEGAPQMNLTSGTSWVANTSIAAGTNYSGSVNITEVKTSGGALVKPTDTTTGAEIPVTVQTAGEDGLTYKSANIIGASDTGITLTGAAPYEAAGTGNAAKFSDAMFTITGSDKGTYTLTCTAAGDGAGTSVWSVKDASGNLVAVNKTATDLGLDASFTGASVGATLKVESGSSTALNGELKFTPADNKLTYTDATGNIRDVTCTSVLNGANYEITASVPTPFSGSGVTQNVVFTVPKDYYEANLAKGMSLGTVTAKNATITASVYNKGGEEQKVEGTWTSGQSTITLGNITLDLDTKKFNKLDLQSLVNTKLGNVSSGDGTIYTIGQLALATFTNQDGLLEAGSGYYTISANSGAATISVPGNNGTGSLKASSLEMSNVDLAAEFTEMIFAERGFQANSRVITTSDTLLEELVNLVR